MDTVTQQNTAQETPRAITEAVAWATGWGDLAAFLTAHKEIAAHAGTVDCGRVLCYLGHRVEDPAGFMVAAAQACLNAGGRVERDHSGGYGGVNLWFGPVHIDVFTEASRVCSRRATGMVERVEYTLTFDLPEQAQAVSR